MPRERVLITVKTYPTLSRKHGELVCTAAVREDGSWVRLYPIPFPLLEYHERYSKFEWVETTLVKSSSDPRPETLNHQVLGVNNAVASVRRQEELKREFPPEKRLTYRVVELPKDEGTDGDFISTQSSTSSPQLSPPLRAEERVSEGRERSLSGSEEHADEARTVTLVESAHPDLGKLGVYWHTQGSSKSYSMAFFADIRKVVEKKLEQMLARNPQRMDYYRKYSEIIADYNRDKDRVMIEDTFAKLVDLVTGLDAEGRRAAEEGLSEDEYALFCLLQKEDMAKTEREKVKLASRGLLDSLRKLISQRERWTEKEQTQAEVEVLILDHIFSALPTPPFTEDEKHLVSKRVYQHVWQQCTSGHFAITFRA